MNLKLYSTSPDKDLFYSVIMIEEEHLNLDEIGLIYHELTKKLKRITEIVYEVLLIFKEYKIDESHTAN